MLTNNDAEANQEISKLIQSAQNDMSIAISLRVEAPTEALTRCEAAIDSFKQVLRLFVGETDYDHAQLISIKDLLIKSYQLQADIYEQYGISKARYCYMQVEKLEQQDLEQYFSGELTDNDYLNDFDVEHTLEGLHINDVSKEEPLRLPNISMSSLVNRSVSQDIADVSHRKQRTQQEHDLEQVTESISSFGLHEPDIDKEPDLMKVEQSLVADVEQEQQSSPKQKKPKAKKSKGKVSSENDESTSYTDHKLAILLNIANEGRILADWQNKLTAAIEIFLNEVKTKVVEAKKLKPRTVLISYYVNDEDRLGVKNMTELLGYVLQAINMPVDIKLLTDDVEDLKKDIEAHKLIIVLCTPAYAQQVERFPEIRHILDDFGQSKKDCLHTLLCDGGFVDTALKVVDKYYLIRDYKLAFVREEIKDPLTRLLFLIEALFNTSGRDGLGVLPDLLNLKVNQHNIAKKLYKKLFKGLEDAAQTATIEYRVRNHLQESYTSNPVTKYLNLSSIPCDIGDTEITALLSNFQSNFSAKTMLLISPGEADVALVNLHLEQLLLQQRQLTLTIDCGNYPGKIAHQCVHLALRQLNFKNIDIEELQRQEITIILKNYERIGVYDNLYVKNKLSQWSKVKVIITCRADFLERRDYKSYFLSDPGDPKLETLDIREIKSIEFQSERDKPELDKLLIIKEDQLSPNAQTKELHHGFLLNTKQQAQHDELTYFLKEVNKLLVANNLLQKQISKNPQLFISYAWETGASLIKQQGHLRAIVKHLTTLGIPAWLDVERMTGNIDQQMASNIENSAFVMLIGTPKYAQRAMMETNVKKEYDAILEKTKQDKLKTVPALFADATYDICLIPEEVHVYLTPKEPSPEKLASPLTPTIVYDADNGIACLILKIKNNIQKITITAAERDQFKDFIQKNTTNKTVTEQGLRVSLTDQRELLLWLIKKGYNPFTEKLQHNSPPTLVYRADKKISFLVLKEQEQTITLDDREQAIFAEFIAKVNERTAISDKGLSVSIKDQSEILSWLNSKDYKPFTDKLGNSDPAIVIYADANKITVLQEYEQPKIIELSDADQDCDIARIIEQHTKTHQTTGPLKISLSIEDPIIPWLIAKSCRPSQFRDLFEHAKSIGHCTIDLRSIDDAEAYIKQLTEILIPSLLDLKASAHEKLYKEYQQQLSQLHKRLAFLPAEHLIVDIGQDLVQAYDIDNRLKIYIKPQIWRYVPVIVSANQKLDKTDQNKIYLEKNSDGSIKYTIINNATSISATITKEQLLSLNPATQGLLAQLEQNFSLDNIKPLLPYILQISATNGHITADVSTPEDQRDLQKSFEAFLAKEVTEAKNYVVLGEAGSGKTLFTLRVFKELLLKEWHGYKKKKARLGVFEPPKWLPVYIPLKLYSSEPAERCIHRALEVYELDKQDIESLKKGLGTEQGVVFILDGYDELSEASRKDYTSILSSWTYSKVLLTSRPEHFNRQSNSEEHYIAPLSDAEKKEFIIQYKKVKPETKLDDASKVFEILQNMPSLMPLLDNPFLLNLVLQVLPELLKSKTSDKDITRADIYQAFTNLWFTKETIRHTEDPANTEESNRFAELLSFKMRQAKTISVTSGADNDLAKFFDNAKKGARLSCPLQRTGQEYGYIHKSLYEYFLSNSLYLPENHQELAKPIFYAKTLIDEPSVLRFSMELRTPRNIALKSYHNHRLQLFLNLVGWGEQEAADRMLQLNPQLANLQGNLTDCSGRTWENITALQYSLLALDYHMWTMILKYINKEEARAQIKSLTQIANLNEQKGWIITANSANWPSLVWHQLITALEEYVKNYDAWNSSQCNQHWCQQVGGAQLILPAHVINEYSHPNRANGFNNCTWDGSNTDSNLPRTGVADWINNSGYKLGSEFAWLRGEGAVRLGSKGNKGQKYMCYHVNIALAAMTELLQSRTGQAQTLVAQLTGRCVKSPKVNAKITLIVQ